MLLERMKNVAIGPRRLADGGWVGGGWLVGWCGVVWYDGGVGGDGDDGDNGNDGIGDGNCSLLLIACLNYKF